MKYSKKPHLQKAAETFVQRYASINSSNLGLDNYNKMYLSKYLEKIEYNTYLACALIETLDLNYNAGIADIGGGIGFNAAFFSHLGFEKVLYLDIDAASKTVAEKINKSLGFNNIEYVVGSYNDIKKATNKYRVLTSRDVIEHIYDLTEFFKVTSNYEQNRHNTSAIKDSILRKNSFKEIHFKAENKNRDPSAIKQRDTHLSYRILRENYIKKNYGHLETNLNKLVDQTRGLMFEDIDKAINNNIYPPFHLETIYDNTCDPRTGNWAERVLSLEDYKLFAGNSCQKLAFRLCKYNQFRPVGIEKIVKSLLNLMVAKSQNVRLAPSFIIEY